MDRDEEILVINSGDNSRNNICKWLYLVVFLSIQLSWIIISLVFGCLPQYKLDCEYKENYILYTLIIINSILSIYSSLDYWKRGAHYRLITSMGQKSIVIILIVGRMVYGFSDCSGNIGTVNVFFSSYIVIEYLALFTLRVIAILCIRCDVLLGQPSIMAQLAGELPINIGATDQEIRSLPIYIYDGNLLVNGNRGIITQLAPDDKYCCICLDNYQEERDNAISLSSSLSQSLR